MDTEIHNKVFQLLKSFPRNRGYSYALHGGAACSLLIKKKLNIDTEVANIDLLLNTLGRNTHKERVRIYNDFVSQIKELFLYDNVTSSYDNIATIYIKGYPAIHLFINEVDDCYCSVINGIAVSNDHYKTYMEDYYKDLIIIETSEHNRRVTKRIEEKLAYLKRI